MHSDHVLCTVAVCNSYYNVDVHLNFNMTRICAMIGCSNSTYHLYAWYSRSCAIHNRRYGSCVCEPPFMLFPFPRERKYPEAHKRWIEIVNRQTKTGQDWKPTMRDRICSKHFKEGEPSETWPDPTECLGYDRDPSKNSKFSKTGKRKRKIARDKPIDVVPMPCKNNGLGREALAKKAWLQDHDYLKSDSQGCQACYKNEIYIGNL